MKKFQLLLVLTTLCVVPALAQRPVDQQQQILLNQGTDLSVTALPAVNGNKMYAPDAELPKRGGSPATMVAFSDDFSMPNDTNGLKARGYLPYYRGVGPTGVTACWYQGNSTIFTDYNNGNTNYVASDYNSVTNVNDLDNWLVLPAMNIAAGDVISFYIRTISGSTFPDSVSVMYSAVGDSVPEDLSWVELERFKVSTVNMWVNHTDTAPSPGATARFAFRYNVVNSGPNGPNGNYIGIDQIDVFTPPTNDLSVLSINRISKEYTRIPQSQLNPVAFNALVRNNGLATAAGGTALFEVIDTSSASVVFSETVNIPNLNAGDTMTVSTTNSFSPMATGHYQPQVTVSIAGDANAANDLIQNGATEVTDTIFSRDNGIWNGTLGIFNGPPKEGKIGMNYYVTNATNITSISFYMNSGFNPSPAGTVVYATIHSQPAHAHPDDIPLAITDSILFIPNAIPPPGDWYTLTLPSPLYVTPGYYFIGMYENDSLLRVSTSSQIYSDSAIWVTWNTIPSPPAVGGWAAVEYWGHTRAYSIRLNIDGTTGVPNINGDTDMLLVYPSPATDLITIDVNSGIRKSTVEVFNELGMLVQKLNNVSGTTSLDVSSYAKGVYTVRMEADGKIYKQPFTVIR